MPFCVITTKGAGKFVLNFVFLRTKNFVRRLGAPEYVSGGYQRIGNHTFTTTLSVVIELTDYSRLQKTTSSHALNVSKLYKISHIYYETIIGSHDNTTADDCERSLG